MGYNRLGYRYRSVKAYEVIKLLDVRRESRCFFGRIRPTDIIDRMIEETLDLMNPVGINPRVGDALVCQYIQGEEADQKWHRAQIVSNWLDMYRVIFVDHGRASEYHENEFHRYARIPTKELMKKPITCIRFKDKSDYSAVGARARLDDLMLRYKKKWRFQCLNGLHMQIFRHDTVFRGRISISIEGGHVG